MPEEPHCYTSEPMRWFDLFEASVLAAPKAVALQQEGTTLSYETLGRLVDAVAARLAAKVERGSLIAVWSPNDIYAQAFALGVIRAGCVLVPVNPRSRADEVLDLLSRIGCRLLFHHPVFEQQLSGNLSLAKELTEFVQFNLSNDDLIDLSIWRAGAGSMSEPPKPAPNDTAILFSTSGSSGEPKSVMTSHANLWALSRCFAEALDFDSPPKFLAVTPMTHTAGLMSLAVLAFGGTTAVQEGFEPASMLRAIRQEAIDMTYLPPTGLYKLLAMPAIERRDCASLRHFLIGGMPLSAAKLREAVKRLGPVMVPCYGQVEALWISFLLPQDWPDSGEVPERLWQSCGRAAPSVQIAILDERGEALPDGEEGEIAVRSPMVMKGYSDVDDTPLQPGPETWHRTGDLGYRDEEGFLYLSGRKKDMIISGGFNVAPAEVENVLLSHPAVADCVVFGVADPLWGEAVRARVTLRPRAMASEAALIAHCRAKLADFKCPKAIEVAADIPTTATGKASRRALASLHADPGRGLASTA